MSQKNAASRVFVICVVLLLECCGAAPTAPTGTIAAPTAPIAVPPPAPALSTGSASTFVLSGKVTGSSGQPIAAASVRVVLASTPTNSSVVATVTSADGMFHLSVTAAFPVELEVNAPGYFR